jgi:hypothetical protein
MSKKINLTEEICGLLNAKAELESLKEKMSPQMPVLKTPCTIPEYVSWQENLRRWQAKETAKADNIAEALDKIFEINQTLINYLPASHTWFLTEDEKYAIAIQRSDWPMDPPKLKIVENPDIDALPELKLQIVNPN